MTVHCPKCCCNNPCVVEYSSYEMFSLFEMGGIFLTEKCKIVSNRAVYILYV